MAGPKEIEAKLRRVITSWENLAPAKSFGGMTLEQFKTQTAPSFTTRETVINLEGQLTQAKNQRDDADRASSALTQRVINGVLADPEEGPDSSLIEAMGRVRQSERKSGLTKKASSGGTSPSP